MIRELQAFVNCPLRDRPTGVYNCSECEYYYKYVSGNKTDYGIQCEYSKEEEDEQS